MSDPVTNTEVEDVLSSIRRLVSEDKRPSAAQSAPAADDRLVLTPALRVTEGGQSEAKKDEPDVAEKQVEFLQAVPDPEPIEEDDEVVIPAQSLGADMAAEPTLADLEDEIEDIEFELDAPADTSSLTEKITALETAIGSIRQDWDPEDADKGDYAATASPSLAWEDDVALDAKGAPIVNAPGANEAEPIEEPRELDFEAVSKSQTLYDIDPESAAAISEAEREMFRRNHMTPRFSVEPAMDEGTVVDEQSEPKRFDPPQAETAPEPDAIDNVQLGETVLDEAALQDLVSEIVRKELQGALGERITRNVRKLVRREIQRALSAQTLE